MKSVVIKRTDVVDDELLCSFDEMIVKLSARAKLNLQVSSKTIISVLFGDTFENGLSTITIPAYSWGSNAAPIDKDIYVKISNKSHLLSINSDVLPTLIDTDVKYSITVISNVVSLPYCKSITGVDFDGVILNDLPVIETISFTRGIDISKLNAPILNTFTLYCSRYTKFNDYAKFTNLQKLNLKPDCYETGSLEEFAESQVRNGRNSGSIIITSPYTPSGVIMYKGNRLNYGQEVTIEYSNDGYKILT